MRRIGYSLVVAGAILTLVQTWMCSSNLPERVASHFGPNGLADGWMTKTSLIGLHIGLQAATAGLLLAIAKYGRHLPDSLLNMPHKDYWLHRDRRRETFDYTEGLLTCIAGLTVIFLAGVFHLVYQANVDGTNRLSARWFWPLLIGYFALLIWLIVRMSLRFRLPKEVRPEGPPIPK